MATYSNILAREIPWTEEPGGLQSMGSKRVRHCLATKEQHIYLWSRYDEFSLKLLSLKCPLNYLFALYSIESCFYHQSHLQLGVVLLWLHPFILSGVISPLIPVAYSELTDLGSSSFSVLSFFLFILFMGFSSQEY